MTRRKIRVTSHARSRARERLGVSYHAEVNKSLNDALTYGHPLNDFVGNFADFLKNKKKKYGKSLGIKVYMDIIVFYRNKTVITTYMVPEKFRPASDYLKVKGGSVPYSAYLNRSSNDLPYVDKLRERLGVTKIYVESTIEESGLFRTALYLDDIFIRYGLGRTQYRSINNAIRSYLKTLDVEVINNEEDEDTE